MGKLNVQKGNFKWSWIYYNIHNIQKTFHYSTPFPLADQIRKDVPGLEYVTRVHHPFQSVIEINPAKRFRQDHVMMTDPEFLDVFDVKIIEGNAYEALRKPYQALLTETTTRKFFGNEA